MDVKLKRDGKAEKVFELIWGRDRRGKVFSVFLLLEGRGIEMEF